MNKKKKPTIAITLGDPLGIGPEIVAKALKDPFIKKSAEYRIFGTIALSHYRTIAPKEAGQISWNALNEAITSIKKGECDALVTGPVSKTHLKLAGFPFPGHTEYLMSQFGVKKAAMMLASKELKVVLCTIHVPLKQVFKLLTTDLILEKIVLTHEFLNSAFVRWCDGAIVRNTTSSFANALTHHRTNVLIPAPKIAVCGLNPHAGENGLFGNEEKTIIIPAIKKAQKKGINVTGPYPPDTVFHLARKGEFDAVICHYHDQGLIALKTLSFDTGVNVTLGLPIIRTSPDHGPAFDIAGKNKANPESMKEAIKIVLKNLKT